MKREKYTPKPCVYVITHVPSKRHYVGKANDVRKRWKQHRYAAASGRKHTSYIAKAIRKYGLDQFQFVVAEEFETETEAYAAEVFWIEFLRSDMDGYGFNRSKGGEVPGLKRFRRSPELTELIASQSLDMRYERTGSIHNTMRATFRAKLRGEPCGGEVTDMRLDLRFAHRQNPWGRIRPLPESIGRMVTSISDAPDRYLADWRMKSYGEEILAAIRKIEGGE